VQQGAQPRVIARNVPAHVLKQRFRHHRARSLPASAKRGMSSAVTHHDSVLLRLASMPLPVSLHAAYEVVSDPDLALDVEAEEEEGLVTWCMEQLLVAGSPSRDGDALLRAVAHRVSPRTAMLFLHSRATAWVGGESEDGLRRTAVSARLWSAAMSGLLEGARPPRPAVVMDALRLLGAHAQAGWTGLENGVDTAASVAALECVMAAAEVLTATDTPPTAAATLLQQLMVAGDGALAAARRKLSSQPGAARGGGSRTAEASVDVRLLVSRMEVQQAAQGMAAAVSAPCTVLAAGSVFPSARPLARRAMAWLHAAGVSDWWELAARQRDVAVLDAPPLPGMLLMTAAAATVPPSTGHLAVDTDVTGWMALAAWAPHSLPAAITRSRGAHGRAAGGDGADTDAGSDDGGEEEEEEDEGEEDALERRSVAHDAQRLRFAVGCTLLSCDGEGGRPGPLIPRVLTPQAQYQVTLPALYAVLEHTVQLAAATAYAPLASGRGTEDDDDTAAATALLEGAGPKPLPPACVATTAAALSRLQALALAASPLFVLSSVEVGDGRAPVELAVAHALLALTGYASVETVRRQAWATFTAFLASHHLRARVWLLDMLLHQSPDPDLAAHLVDALRTCLVQMVRAPVGGQEPPRPLRVTASPAAQAAAVAHGLVSSRLQRGLLSPGGAATVRQHMDAGATGGAAGKVAAVNELESARYLVAHANYDQATLLLLRVVKPLTVGDADTVAAGTWRLVDALYVRPLAAAVTAHLRRLRDEAGLAPFAPHPAPFTPPSTLPAGTVAPMAGGGGACAVLRDEESDMVTKLSLVDAALAPMLS